MLNAARRLLSPLCVRIAITPAAPALLRMHAQAVAARHDTHGRQRQLEQLAGVDFEGAFGRHRDPVNRCRAEARRVLLCQMPD